MDQALPASGTYVCHGITWASGDPRLLLAPVPGGPLVHAAITGRRLGYQVSGTGRWCTGRYRFADRVRVEAVACPDRAPAEVGGQCAACVGQDDFRFAHQFHSGGHVPDALAAYMAQPHWLYLATFADGTTKVGTAAEPRKRSRLDEQGAVIATYLAQSPRRPRRAVPGGRPRPPPRPDADRASRGQADGPGRAARPRPSPRRPPAAPRPRRRDPDRPEHPCRAGAVDAARRRRPTPDPGNRDASCTRTTRARASTG